MAQSTQFYDGSQFNSTYSRGIPIYYIYGDEETTNEYIHSSFKDYSIFQGYTHDTKYDSQEIYWIDQDGYKTGRQLLHRTVHIQNRHRNVKKWKPLRGIIVTGKALSELKPKTCHQFLEKVMTIINIKDLINHNVEFEEYYSQLGRHFRVKYNKKL